LTVIPVGTILKIGSKTFKVEQLIQRGGKNYAKITGYVETVVSNVCKIASTPTWVERLMGTVRAEAATICSWITNLINTQNFGTNRVAHTILGEISPTGAAGGYHSILSPIGRKVGAPTATRTLTNGDIIYTSVVEVSDDTGNWIRKSAESTFFPDTWSAQKIVDNVNDAYTKGARVGITGNVFEYTNPTTGMKIRYFLENLGTSTNPIWGKIISAFPVI
jgi:Bacterial EndoU nuclease